MEKKRIELSLICCSVLSLSQHFKSYFETYFFLFLVNAPWEMHVSFNTVRDGCEKLREHKDIVFRFRYISLLN